MKKNTVNIFIILFLISNVFCSVYALQQNTNATFNRNIKKNKYSKIDIRKIVQQQIEKAKNKKLNIKNINSLNNNVYETKNSGLNKYFIIALTIIKKIDARILILTGASIIIFLFIGIRRTRINEGKVNKKSKSLPKNIAMIRNEEPIIIEDRQLTKVRQKLIKKGYKKENLINKNVTNTFANQVYKRSKLSTDKALMNFNYEVSNTAKKLSISKSEILLALKLKTYELGKGNLIKN